MDIKIEPIDEDQPDLIDLNLIKSETPEDLQCPTCSENFNCEFLLKVHQMLHDPEEYCFICKRKCPNNIDVHVLGKHFNQCELCLKTFTERKALRKHMELHTGELTYLKCNQCDKVFRQTGSLTVHIRATHQGLKPYTCTQCKAPVSFTTKSGLKRHIKKFHDPNRPKKDYTKKVLECSFCHEPQKGWKMKRDHEIRHRACKMCKSCDKTFRTPFELRKHFAVDHATPGWFPCERCWMNFNSTYLLKKHQEKHQENRYSCQECNLFYSKRSSLYKHKKTYHNPDQPLKIDRDNLKCRYCSETFSSVAQRQKHTRKNCRADKTVCQLCQKDCSNIYSLHTHMRRNHTQLHTCPYCQKRYSKLQLKRHLKNAHKERKCHHCDEVFHIYKNYHKHLFSHKVDIARDVCDKNLRNIYTEKLMKHHQNLNEQEECHYCRKKVVNLKMHLARAHTCPLHCDLIGKLFTTMGLRAHYRMHHPSDIKCSKCYKNMSKSQMKWHMWKIHNTKRFYLCNKCGIFFYDRRCYRRHKMRHLSGTIRCLMCGQRYIDERVFRKHHCVKKFGRTKSKTGNPSMGKYHSLRIISNHGELRALEDKKIEEVASLTGPGNGKYQCKTCFKLMTGLRSAKKHHCGENREIGKRKFCNWCEFRFFTKNTARLRDHILRCRLVKTEEVCPDYVNGEDNVLLEGRDFKVKVDVKIEESEGNLDFGSVLKNENC